MNVCRSRMSRFHTFHTYHIGVQLKRKRLHGRIQRVHRRSGPPSLRKITNIYGFRIPYAFRWRADDGPLIVVFGSFLPSSNEKINNNNKKTKKQKKKNKRYQSWTPSDKAVWIRACFVASIHNILKQMRAQASSLSR